MNDARFAEDALRLIGSRHSKRAFLPDPVPDAWIDAVLSAAAQAASSKNSQPWAVEIVTGAARESLSSALCRAFDADEPPRPDYRYSPDPAPEGFDQRARELGRALFDWKGIDRGDAEARRLHDRENFTFFNAPLELIFHLPPGAERGNFLDLGLFVQNVMLGLLAHGVSSCPQASLARYPDAIKTVLGLPRERVVVCGLACGFADPDAKVNAFVPPRRPLSEWARRHA